MGKTLQIILICAGVLAGIAVIYTAFQLFKNRKKKTVQDKLQKKAKTVSKESTAKNNKISKKEKHIAAKQAKQAKKAKEKGKTQPDAQPPKPKSELDLLQEQIDLNDFTPKKDKQVEGQPVFSDFVDDEDWGLGKKSDNDEFNDIFGKQDYMEQKDSQNDAPKPTLTLDEILRSRAERAANKEYSQPQVTDDGFDDFMARHSSFTSYKPDKELIEQVKGLSPQMKAVVFSNLFNKLNHDKY